MGMMMMMQMYFTGEGSRHAFLLKASGFAVHSHELGLCSVISSYDMPVSY